MSHNTEEEKDGKKRAEKRDEAGAMAEVAACSGDADAAAPASANAAAPAADEVELAVEEDRAYLALSGVGYLMLALAGLFLVAGGIGAAQITQSLAYLVLMVVGLPVAWFASKAMGRRFQRLWARAHVVDFGRRHLTIWPASDPKKPLELRYRDVKNYKLIRQGASLRLLLSGEWVEHPSGYLLVSITRPFSTETLGELESRIPQIMKAHRVNERR